MTIFTASERIKRFLARGWTVVIIVVLAFLIMNPDILSVKFLMDKVIENPQFMAALYCNAYSEGVFYAAAYTFSIFGLCTFSGI